MARRFWAEVEKVLGLPAFERTRVGVQDEPAFQPEICGAQHADPVIFKLLLTGTSLASFDPGMSEIALPSTYNEPTVMWRMAHRNGRWAQAVIDPLTDGARAQWFVNGHLLTSCDFADWTGAIAWTDRLRAQQWTVGWRLSEDIPEGPAARSSS